MSGSDPEREFAFLDPEALYAKPLVPVSLSPEQALQEVLLDLIQLAEREGLEPETVDAILETICDERASRTREGFVVHRGEGAAE
ncbi:MAG TPA: hypothetical protein DEA08_03195 [Planctomycetes bacterium]|nr:hypothetical protein [Planctomycetota bacterium]